MKSKKSKVMLPFSGLAKYTCAVSVLLVLSGVLARPLSLSLADMSFSRVGGGAPLAQRGIRMSNFKMKVGGVAFAAIAAPSRDDLELLGLRYSPGSEDGMRLEFHVSDAGVNKWVPFPAYDWELVPCAMFVSDPDDNEACFTLFGEMLDPDVGRQLTKDGKRILNYHPAFENTLMGLRLFQADILLLSESAADLPKVPGAVVGPGGIGQGSLGYVLGNGEEVPSLEDNRAAFKEVREWLDERSTSFSSYVICDESQEVVFEIDDDGVLEVSGNPQWYCWTFSPAYESAKELAIDQIKELAIIRAFVSVNLGGGTEIDSEKQIEVLEQAQRYFEEFATEEQINEIISESVAEDEKTIDLKALSRALTAQIESNDGINPEVHRALTKTMHLSALFRAAKRLNPPHFAQFIASLSDVEVVPAVETPDNVAIPEEAQRRRMLQDLLDELRDDDVGDEDRDAAPAQDSATEN